MHSGSSDDDDDDDDELVCGEDEITATRNKTRNSPVNSDIMSRQP